VRLLNEARLTGVQRFVFLSSGGTVYGPAQSLPIAENHPTDPINAYGITKLAVEKYLHMFHVLYGLDTITLRPSVPYGPGQDPHRRQGAVGVFLHCIATRQPIEIWGDGNVRRDYFYIDDLVSAVLASLQIDSPPVRVFNVGGGRSYSLNDLLTLLGQITGREPIVRYCPGRKFDVPDLLLDTTRARTHLNWEPTVTLQDGIARTWEWILTL